MGVSIDTVTTGISRQGVENFRQQIHQEAIVETKRLLGEIDGITSALEAGWQGVAEENFVRNLQNMVKKTQDALDILDEALTSEFSQIVNAMVTADEEMVAVEE